MVHNTHNRLLGVQKKLLLRSFLAMLEEDVGYRDVTTSSLISEFQQAKCLIFSRESGVVAGIELAGVFLKELGAKVASIRIDGEHIQSNELLLEATGPASLFPLRMVEGAATIPLFFSMPWVMASIKISALV